MGHRNTQFTGHIIDAETEQQDRSHLHPEPCIFYGSVANYPQPNIHSVLNYRHVPERQDSLFYGVPQLNTMQPQHPATNLELTVAAPSGHYNPYLVHPISGIRDFPFQVNHGAHDHRIVGVPADSYGRNIPYMDGIRGSFKRKNVEYHNNASAGPSSSVTVTAVPAESDITLMDGTTSFLPYDYGGSDPTSTVESGSHRSVRNRPGMIGPESHSMQGNYVAPPVQLPGNPWMDMHFGANNGDVGTYAWTHAPLPYVHASVNGACVEAGNLGVQGYQLTASNRSSGGFLHPSLPHGHPNPHHPPPHMQGVRGYNVNFPAQVATSSRRISSVNSSSSSISNPFQDVVDAGTSFLSPVPSTGFRLYRPHRRETLLDTTARHHHTLPHLRVLPEDEVAILEIPGYHEAGDSNDQHRDMRLDIDHMSYEELLALGEQIGSVGTGLSEEFIRNNLKIRTFTSPPACLDLDKTTSVGQQIKFCVICQTDYEDEDKIGTLDCGHEYHRECVKKWLLVKNTCPVCKSTGLTRKAKDS